MTLYPSNQTLLRRLLAAASAVALAGAARPQDAPPVAPAPLNLDAAIRTALANHKQIGVAQTQSEAARARLTEAKSAWFPQVAPLYTMNVRSSDHNTGTLNSTTHGLSVGLQQTIFDSGRREIGIAQSRDAVRAADLGVLDTRESVILNVTTAWYDLLRSKDLVRVAESSLARAKTTLDATRAFVEAGSSPRKDILQAEADYTNAQVQAIQARNSVRLAETALRTAMGLMTPEPITTPAEPVPAPSTAPDTRDIQTYVDEALANRPDLLRSQANLDATRRSVKLAAINAGPQLQSTLDSNYSAHPNPGIDSVIAVSVTYPLFDAGASRARVREAKAGLRGAQDQLELSRQTVAADVESAYLVREEARTRIGAAQAALTAAQANYDAATQSQKEGVGTILDVITAENALITAETSAVQAVYDFYTADARLSRAVGANDPYISGGKS